MNLKDLLKQYNDLKAEIENLEKRIEKCKKVKKETDRVTGSNPEFPYEPRSFIIEGYGIIDAEKLDKLESLLVDRNNSCQDIKLKIEEFISTIPDSKVRRVFQYRYIDELEWLPISRRIGGYEESYARKIHDRYLESID